MLHESHMNYETVHPSHHSVCQSEPSSIAKHRLVLHHYSNTSHISAFKYQRNQTIDVGFAGLLSKQWTPIRHILSLSVTANAAYVTAYVVVRRSLNTTQIILMIRLSYAYESINRPSWHTVYPKKYAHGFCFAVLCCGYTLTDFPISIRLTSLALWQSDDCPSASKATLVNMDKYFMWIHYERLHNHNKAKHNKTVCIFLGIYCTMAWSDCTAIRQD